MKSVFRILPLFFLLCAFPQFAGAQAASPLQQLFMLKELKPDLKKIGVVISESNPNKAAILADVQKAGARTGITIVLAPINDINELGPKVRDLTRTYSVQALWVPGGDKVLDTDVARTYLAKSAAQDRLVLMAPSEEWVKKGACLTLQGQGEGVKIVVNKAIATSLAVNIPEKYKDKTQFN